MDKLPPLHAPDSSRRVQGRKNRAEGKAFEERLDQTFAYYAKTGYALIDKTPEPFKVTRRMENARFVGCFQKKAQPDYKGTIKGGRTVIFEAKYTSTDRITQDRVNDTQSSYMEQASELGARCFVLVGFPSRKVYKIPWNVWRDMKQYFGRKYVTERDLKNYAVSGSWNGLLLVLD